METYVVELEKNELGSFALTVPALPGLLILGLSVEEVLERARAAVEFHPRDADAGPGSPRVSLSPRSHGALEEVTPLIVI